jgi:hypothetical protein
MMARHAGSLNVSDNRAHVLGEAVGSVTVPALPFGPFEEPRAETGSREHRASSRRSSTRVLLRQALDSEGTEFRVLVAGLPEFLELR